MKVGHTEYERIHSLSLSLVQEVYALTFMWFQDIHHLQPPLVL